jgi:hypothetical protein
MFGIDTEILGRWLRAHLKVWVTEQDLNWVSTPTRGKIVRIYIYFSLFLNIYFKELSNTSFV